MSRIRKLLDFSNFVFLLTNLWIFIFHNLLQFLNFNFPLRIPEGFIRSGVFPKPFDIPLYLSITFIGVLSVWFLKTVFKKENFIHFDNLVLSFSTFIFLAGLFIVNIGTYPMARSTYPYGNADNAPTYHLYLAIYIFVALFITLEAVILDKVVKTKKKIFYLFFFFFTVFIAVVTFEPRFPLVGHDYSYFFGPIWEVVHGKTLYTQVPSQYGFGAILFLAFLYKLHLINVFYLPAFVWILYIVEYGLSFYIVYRLGKNLGLAVLGTLSVITLNYFSLYLLPATIPQTGPLRWLPLVISLFFLVRSKDITNKKFIFITSLASFWVLDSGLALILTLGFTLFLLLLNRDLTLKKFVGAAVTFGISLLLIYAGINLYQILAGYKTINIASTFLLLQQYVKAGFGMIPMDSYTYFWVVLLIYFAAIIYHFRKSQPVLLFTANLSLFASVYFVGRSHPHNLFHISVFAVLTVFILFGLVLKNQPNRVKLLTYALLFLFFIAYPVFERQEVMTEMVKTKLQNLAKGNIFTPEFINVLQTKYKKEIPLINSNISDRKIVILSPDDTYLFYLTGKDNLLDANSEVTVLTKNDMDAALKNLYSQCPKKIVVDCTLMGKCQNSQTFVKAFFSIQQRLLNQIESVCRVNYQPKICTDKLCIAEYPVK